MTRNLLATVLLAAFGLSTALHAQSLADLAKKTAEERAAKAKKEQGKTDDTAKTDDAKKPAATKFYTNKDLVDVPSPPAAPVVTKTEPAAKDNSSEVATKKPDEPVKVKDEAYWRARMATLHGNLVRDIAACEPLAAKIRELDSIYASSVFYDKDGKARINTAAAAVIETKQADARTEQRQCLATVALDQTAIDTAEEEARRLAVLPGWLR